jgi:hypothetical protein
LLFDQWKPTMKKMFAAHLLLVLALPFSAAAQERQWMPYKKLVELVRIDKFYALPPAERDKVQLYALLNPVNKSVKPADVRLTIVDGATRQPLPLDARGRALVVPNPKWLADNAQIWTSLPAGEKMNIGFDLGAILPAATQWNYASVMGSVPQANAALGKVAGMMSMFVPKMKSVIFKFDKPAQLTIHARGGDQRYATDANNHLRLGANHDLLKENPLVTLSERPFEGEIDTN